MSLRGTAIAAALLVLGHIAPARADRLDTTVRAEMARQRIPGVSIAVIRDGRSVVARGYGLANLECSARVTPDTVFQIQSMTKSFTAIGILMLVEDGKVGLDDAVGEYLPGTPDSWKAVTIRRLLNHTAGLKDFINDATQSLRLDVTDEELLAATAVRPLDFAPGSRYRYSNTNYSLLGMVIRKVTSMSWGDFLAEHVFRPLKMDRTRIYSWSDIIPNRADGYRPSGDGWRNGEYYAPSVLGYPGGGILSTARDLAKWDIALSEGRFLTEATRRQMWSPARLNDGTTSSYGFGWALGAFDGRPYQAHTGAHSSGFSSAVLRLPDDHLSVIVLANVEGADAFGFARRIAGDFVPAVRAKP